MEFSVLSCLLWFIVDSGQINNIKGGEKTCLNAGEIYTQVITFPLYSLLRTTGLCIIFFVCNSLGLDFWP